MFCIEMDFSQDSGAYPRWTAITYKTVWFFWEWCLLLEENKPRCCSPVCGASRLLYRGSAGHNRSLHCTASQKCTMHWLERASGTFQPTKTFVVDDDIRRTIVTPRQLSRKQHNGFIPQNHKRCAMRRRLDWLLIPFEQRKTRNDEKGTGRACKSIARQQEFDEALSQLQ